MTQTIISTTPGPDALARFQLALLKFTLRAEERIELPEFSGSTFRGAFGAMFRRICCPPHCRDVKTCLIASACAYARIFEAVPDVAGYRVASEGGLPRPFIIHPPPSRQAAINPGEVVSFHLALVGFVTDYLPYFILTWRELGREGIGRGRGQFHLEKVESCLSLEVAAAQEQRLIYSATDELVRNSVVALTAERLLAVNSRLSQAVPQPSRLMLELLTPMRLKLSGEFLRASLPFEVLVGALLRRLESLSFFYCGGSLNLDYQGLISEAKGVQVMTRDICWVNWERYSRRQERKIPWGGMMGRVEYQGDFMPFLPFLALGELVGVGNNCAFGLGRYQAYLKGEE